MVFMWFSVVSVCFSLKKWVSCSWHVLGWFGWSGSSYAVNKQVSVVFTLFHVVFTFFVCMLLDCSGC